MGRPEVTGDKPQNHGLSDFTVLSEQRGAGPRVKKPEEQKQQLSDADLEVYKRIMGKRWGATVFENPIRVSRPLPKNPGEQRGVTEPFQPNPSEQQAAERLGKPPPEGVKGEVQQEPAAHQEHPLDSLEDFRQLARSALKPPMSPVELEGIKPEDYEEWARNHPYRAANYATAVLYYEETVENLAQSMATDPSQFTANIIRRYLGEHEERSKPPEE
jgi:hypothetical protein